MAGVGGVFRGGGGAVLVGLALKRGGVRLILGGKGGGKWKEREEGGLLGWEGGREGGIYVGGLNAEGFGIRKDTITHGYSSVHLGIIEYKNLP